jgi:quercetin dioxygenase-like cupin family protein
MHGLVKPPGFGPSERAIHGVLYPRTSPLNTRGELARLNMKHICTAGLVLLCLTGSCGMFAKETTAKPSDTIFSSALQDVPGKRLVVVALELQPKSKGQSTAHRHPGSVYVYVTKGSARLGIDGQPVQEVHAGESFFEPPGALHTVAESASDTETASAIAVLIVPEGAPLLTVEPQHQDSHR